MHATARRPPALDARLLAEKLVSLRYIDGVSYETVRQVLKKNALKAHVVKDLVDVCYPDAERIVLVIDNLNTHTPPRSTKPSRRPKRGGSWSAWRSTTPRSTGVG